MPPRVGLNEPRHVAVGGSQTNMKKIKIKVREKEITVDGMMSFNELENGQFGADFVCCEDVVLEPFTGLCKVQAMRDGNVYITEKPKRIRNKPLFRQNHSSLTLGRDMKYYFILTMDAEEVEELPAILVKEAMEASMKMVELLKKNCYGV